MPTDVRAYTSQLDTDELNFLAKHIRAKVPKGSTKKKLGDILYSHNLKKQDVIAFLSKPQGRTGIYAAFDGKSYEDFVLKHFHSQQYECTKNQRPSRGVEYDIVGVKGANVGNFVSNKSFILVECKNRPLVTNQDLQKFAGKFKGFKDAHEDEVSANISWTKLRHKKPPIQGFIVTSGIFDPLAKEEKEKHIDIELLRLRV